MVQQGNRDAQSGEQLFVQQLVRLACALNKRCGVRRGEEYLGFSVDCGMLESAVHAPFQSFAGCPRYSSVFDRGAALTVHLAANHPFADGNKRTALTMGLTYLKMNSIHVRQPTASDSRMPMSEAGVQLMQHIVGNLRDFDDVISHTSQVFQSWEERDRLSLEYRPLEGH